MNLTLIYKVIPKKFLLSSLLFQSLSLLGRNPSGLILRNLLRKIEGGDLFPHIRKEFKEKSSISRSKILDIDSRIYLSFCQVISFINFMAMAHNVPAVYGVLAARISKCAAFAGRTKCGGVLALEWSEAK
jgi:hypothetical protein